MGPGVPLGVGVGEPLGVGVGVAPPGFGVGVGVGVTNPPPWEFVHFVLFLLSCKPLQPVKATKLKITKKPKVRFFIPPPRSLIR